MLVVIKDFVENRRMTLYFAEEDFASVEKSWNSEDQVLAHLQTHPMFASRRCWGDLDVHHYRLMITKSLSMLAALDETDRLDANHPVVRSNSFLLCAMAICLSKKSDAIIETIHINRVAEIDVSFEYTACLNNDMPGLDVVTKPELTVHTKKDPQ